MDPSLVGKSPLELVQLAVERGVSFKLVGAHLGGEEPSRDASLWLVRAYEAGTAKPWMTAYLLGQARHADGYATIKEILLAAPGSSAESYAGPAMARIDPVRAFADLASIVQEGATRLIREGAAYGIGTIGGKDAVACLVAALRARRISELHTSGILADILEEEADLRDLLRDEETRIAKTGLLVLEHRARRDPLAPLPTPETILLARSALERAKTSPATRRVLHDLFADVEANCDTKSNNDIPI